MTFYSCVVSHTQETLFAVNVKAICNKRVHWWLATFLAYSSHSKLGPFLVRLQIAEILAKLGRQVGEQWRVDIEYSWIFGGILSSLHLGGNHPPQSCNQLPFRLIFRCDIQYGFPLKIIDMSHTFEDGLQNLLGQESMSRQLS